MRDFWLVTVQNSSTAGFRRSAKQPTITSCGFQKFAKLIALWAVWKGFGQSPPKSTYKLSEATTQRILVLQRAPLHFQVDLEVYILRTFGVQDLMAPWDILLKWLSLLEQQTGRLRVLSKPALTRRVHLQCQYGIRTQKAYHVWSLRLNSMSWTLWVNEFGICPLKGQGWFDPEPAPFL